MTEFDPTTPRAIDRRFTSRGAITAYFDKISGVYDLMSDDAEASVRERALQILDARPNERILEIGCATGHATIEIAQSIGSAGHVDALDISPRMMRQTEANVHAMELQDQVSFVIGDATRIPVEGPSYDAVYTSFTVELLEPTELPVALKEIRRVLRPEGRLVVVCFHDTTADPDEMEKKLSECQHQRLPNFAGCHPICLATALEQAGFQIRSSTSVTLWMPVVILVAVVPIASD